jgi:hypothetical protein
VTGAGLPALLEAMWQHIVAEREGTSPLKIASGPANR